MIHSWVILRALNDLSGPFTPGDEDDDVIQCSAMRKDEEEEEDKEEEEPCDFCLFESRTKAP